MLITIGMCSFDVYWRLALKKGHNINTRAFDVLKTTIYQSNSHQSISKPPSNKINQAHKSPRNKLSDIVPVVW